MLIAIDAVGIREGGAVAVLAELLTWLPRVRPDWRWHVFLFERHLRDFDNPPVSAKVVLETTGHGHRGLGRIRWVERLLPRRLRETGADLVFSFANLGSSQPSVPQVVYCQQRLVLFHEAHAEYPLLERLRLRVQSFFARRGARASAGVIVQTEGMRARFVQVEPNLKGKIHVIPCGYRTPPATPVIRSKKKRLIDDCGRPRLIYVSILRHHKNHLRLIRGFAEVLKACPQARLMLTVDEHAAPYPEVASLLREARALVQELGLAQFVVWLGQLTADEVTYALSQSDLMVFPSLAESFGLPLVEAMAAGCPIAAADLPYAHDVAGSAAAYLDATAAHSLGEGIVALLHEPQRLEQLRRDGHALSKNFSYERIAEEIAKVFDEAVPLCNRRVGS